MPVNRLEEDGNECIPGGAELTRSMESSFLVTGKKVQRWVRILWKISCDCFYFLSEVESMVDN